MVLAAHQRQHGQHAQPGARHPGDAGGDQEAGGGEPGAAGGWRSAAGEGAGRGAPGGGAGGGEPVRQPEEERVRARPGPSAERLVSTGQVVAGTAV